MFGKLIKYEWKAVMRSMLPIYGALAAISVINAFLFSDLLTGNGAAAINPVSYTHLDVYKRQLPGRTQRIVRKTPAGLRAFPCEAPARSACLSWAFFRRPGW